MFTTDAPTENLKLTVNFVDEPDNPLAHVIEIQSDDVRTKDHDLIFDQSKIPHSSQLHAIQVIVGNRSALLTIDGEIVGAHRLEANSAPEVIVETADQNLKLSPVRSAEITWPSGCANS